MAVHWPGYRQFAAWHRALTPLGIFILLAGAIAATGQFVYGHLKSSLQREKQTELSAIADAKVGEITQWLKERRGDAELIARDFFIGREVEHWLREGAPNDDRKDRLLARLTNLKAIYDYATITLVDQQGRARLGAGPVYQPCTEQEALTTAAMRSGHIMMSDLHQGMVPADDTIDIDLVAPLRTGAEAERPAVGAIIFRIDPAHYLFPLIQHWPTRSSTAETVLVRREGDRVRYLNELRHRKNTALTLSLPLADERLVSAVALRGQADVTEGIDYRQVRVLSAVRAVPGTSWFMVAKIDAAEVEGPIRTIALLLATVVGFFIVSAAVATGLWWRQQRAAFQAEQYRCELERQALIRHFDYLSKYANDIILLTDGQGRIVEANAKAEASYGYAREELLSLPIESLIEHESNGDPVGSHRSYVEGDGRLFEAMHRRKDDSLFPVEVSARQIDIDGKPFRHNIIRDITERKRTEQELLRSHQALRELSASLQSVREEERSQIARELHDELGQDLVALGMDLNWIVAKLPADGRHLKVKAEAMNALLEKTAKSIRRIAADLRPTILDDLGFIPAVEWLLEEYSSRTGIHCELHSREEEMDVRGPLATSLFRIIQEALTNVARHAAATAIDISVEGMNEQLVLRIQDNGKGISAEEQRKPKSFGLLGMRERALMAGGRLRIHSEPRQGTLLEITVPFSKTDMEVAEP